MTIKSHPLDFAVSIIAVAGCAFGICKSSADIPICSAIARASSSTLPARSLQAASKRSTSSCEGIHPEACPLPWSIGSGCVTVMTVTLAFKAFAKAIPCLTPFLATSDPSVLKRILACIRGLPCWSNIFPKSDPYLYGPIVTVSSRGMDAHSLFKVAVAWVASAVSQMKKYEMLSSIFPARERRARPPTLFSSPHPLSGMRDRATPRPPRLQRRQQAG